MPLFHYQALNAKQEQVAGELQAASLAQAVAELESQGMAIQSIGTTPLPAETGDNPFADEVARRRAVDEQAALQQHLATVMERGQHLLPALRAYASELPASRQRRDLDTVLQILSAATRPRRRGRWPRCPAIGFHYLQPRLLRAIRPASSGNSCRSQSEPASCNGNGG